jgi:hypothetical protein
MTITVPPEQPTVATLLGLLSDRLRDEFGSTSPAIVERAIDNARAAMWTYTLDAASYVEAVEHMARGQLVRGEVDRLPPRPRQLTD